MTVLLFSTAAHALSCIWGVYDDNLTQVTSAPPNVEIMVEHTFGNGGDVDLSFTFEGPDGAVPFDLELREGWGRLVPTTLLAPGSYTLSTTGSFEMWMSREFIVEGDLDDEPPAAPVGIRAKRTDQRSEWGRTTGIQMEFDSAPEPGDHYEIELTGSGVTHTVRTTQASELVGRGLCSSTFGDYDKGTAYDVRVRTVDVAGNTSDWVEVRPSAGCSTAPGSAGMLLTLLAPLALFGRRRSAHA